MIEKKKQKYPYDCIQSISKGMGQVILMEGLDESVNHQALAYKLHDVNVLDLMITFPMKVMLRPDLFDVMADTQVSAKMYRDVLLCVSQFVIDAPDAYADMKFQCYPTYTVDEQCVAHVYELPDGVQAVCGVDGVDAMRKYFCSITTSIGVSHLPVLYPKDKECVLHQHLDVQYDRVGFRSERLNGLMHTKVPMPDIILWNEFRMLQEYVWDLVYNGCYGNGFRSADGVLYQSWHDMMPHVL